MDTFSDCSEQSGNQRMERCGIALNIGFNIERLASEHNSDTVVANGTAQ